MTVADNIRRIRKEKNLTQKQLGQKCGIAESTIRRYELGLLNPKFETLQKIADALNVDIYSLDERMDKLKNNRKFISELKKQIQEFESVYSTESSSTENPYARFIEQYSWWIKDAEKENQEIQLQLGDVNTDEFFQEQQLLNSFNKLNYAGKQRALEDVDNLTLIPKYQSYNEL